MYKNYKELCAALDEKVKSGDSKKYQLIDWDRYFQYKKDGHKFVITDIHNEIKVKKTNRTSNNLLPFIDDMEILLIDLLLRNSEPETILSSSKLMLELSMINPNYHKYFMDRDNLSKLLNMDVGYIIDFYDTSNSTFKRAINTVTKRLESKKLIIHESVMMVQFIDTSIQVTPTGHAKVNDILTHDPYTDEYISKNIKPKEVYRPATTEEREYILKVERYVLNNKYNADNIQEVFHSGKIHNYYRDVSRILFNELNIKKAYKANRYTCNVNQLAEQKIKLLTQYELEYVRDKMNVKVMTRIDENSNNRYEKAITKLFEYDSVNEKKRFKTDDSYTDNINTISNSLIDIHNVDSINNETTTDTTILDDMLE